MLQPLLLLLQFRPPLHRLPKPPSPFRPAPDSVRDPRFLGLLMYQAGRLRPDFDFSSRWLETKE